MYNDIITLISEEFYKIDNAETFVLGGSRVANRSDAASDYDFYLYSSNEIDIKQRTYIAEKFSDDFETDNRYWEPGDEWLLRDSSVVVDIMYRSFDFINDIIEKVWLNYNASLGYTTAFIYNLKNSRILFDKTGHFTQLYNIINTEYPEKLAHNIINKNLAVMSDKLTASYTEQIGKAFERNDIVSLNHRISAYIASYFDVLFALNRVLHPGEKKLIKFSLENCKLLPENFEYDLNSLCKMTDIPQILSRLTANLKKLL